MSWHTFAPRVACPLQTRPRVNVVCFTTSMRSPRRYPTQTREHFRFYESILISLHTNLFPKTRYSLSKSYYHRALDLISPNNTASSTFLNPTNTTTTSQTSEKQECASTQQHPTAAATQSAFSASHKDIRNRAPPQLSAIYRRWGRVLIVWRKQWLGHSRCMRRIRALRVVERTVVRGGAEGRR
jgi:hypothetical protein